jgi:hypothetical protein
MGIWTWSATKLGPIQTDILESYAALVRARSVPSELAPMVGSDDFRLSGSGRRHGTESDEPVPEITLTAGTGRCVLAMAGADLKEVPKFIVSPAYCLAAGNVRSASCIIIIACCQLDCMAPDKN